MSSHGDDSLYDQLTTKKLSDISAAEIQTQTDPLHIEKANEGALKATVLINDASMRQSGNHMPGTSIIQTTTVTDNTRTVLFAPQPGEVWVLNAGGAYTTGASSANYQMYISDAPSGGSNLLSFLYDATDDTVVTFTDDSNFSHFQFDENVRIEGIVGGSVTEATWQLHLYRVR